jgi:hypothetical protein
VTRDVRGTMLVCLILVFLGGFLSACSSASPSKTTASTSTPTRSSGSTTSSTHPVQRHVLVATFADNGGTLTVLVHDRIRVVLAGMTWKQQSSNSKILMASGKATVLPAASGCVKNQGCGSVTVFYVAKSTGRAQILGTRSNCAGAAYLCTTAPDSFRLHVVVQK